ncbi:MAG TPA: hypothetical protein ENN28_01655 [Candidatus Uhrbacteria bacterium]|nr:hypothetical protein [Candidatus Uhrbacteria bacterium]
MESLKKTPFSGVDATLEVLGKYGVTSQGLKSLRKNPDLAAKVASLIMTGVRTIFKVTVDYGMSLAEMIQAGQYDWFNDNITDKRFELKGAGQHEVNLVLVHLDRVATTKEVHEYLKEQGLEPAKIEHLLAFGTTYPEVQREFPVVALGSSFVDGHGDRLYPCLAGYGGGRRLNLGLHDDDGHWDGSCRFLAFRK